MKFKDYINETTKFVKVMQYLNGMKDFGVGLGMFTTMNPSAKEISKEDNKRLYSELLSLLKSKGKKYIKQIGQYGMGEKSVIVIDISLREVLDIVKSPIWKQESVIWFSKNSDNKMKSAIIGNGIIIKSKTINSGKAIQELKDFYSIIGNRKYSISFESNKQTFYKLPSGEMVNEEYFTRAKSTVPKKGNIEVYKNPTARDKKALGNIIRFTLDNRTKTAYAWVYDQAHHADIARAVGIKHRFDDPDLLTGAASWKGGRWVFDSSDFLKDFKKMIGSEAEFLNNLINNDWTWANRYIEIDTTLDKLRDYLKGRI